MRSDARFAGQDKQFWAHIRSISQLLGYTDRRTKTIRVYTLADMLTAMSRLGLRSDHLYELSTGSATALGRRLEEYFAYRADVLNTYAEPRLMDGPAAEALYTQYKTILSPTREPPMNKQTGDKAKPAYLTGLVNMFYRSLR